MLRTVLGGKIHRATVTQADLHYVGSITIDQELLEAADILEGEMVHVVDITNGARIETYAITGPRHQGDICINGAAAHLVNPGDLVIIMSYRQGNDQQVSEHQPRVVHVDAQNEIVGHGSDPAEPVPGAPDQAWSRSVLAG